MLNVRLNAKTLFAELKVRIEDKDQVLYYHVKQKVLRAMSLQQSVVFNDAEKIKRTVQRSLFTQFLDSVECHLPEVETRVDQAK